MSPEFGRIWFRAAFFIALVTAIMLPFQKPGTAEFVITALTLGVGLAFIALIVVIVKRSK
jgi:hypothetical protein